MKEPQIAEIVRRDRRFAYEAYEFLFDVLGHAQKRAGRAPDDDESPREEHHVSGKEILEAAVDLARQEFGFMARTVFQQWGIRRTDDLGEIVFNLIEANLFSKTDADSRADFHDVVDLDRALTDGFAIRLSDGAPVQRGGAR